MTKSLRSCRKTIGRKIQYINLLPAQLREALLTAGVPAWNVDALLDLQRLYREGKAAALTQDVQQILGREPVNFAQFARDYKYAFEAREQAAG